MHLVEVALNRKEPSMQNVLLFVFITLTGTWAAAIDCKAVDSYVFSSSSDDLPWTAMTVSEDSPNGAFRAEHTGLDCTFSITSRDGETYSVNITDKADLKSLTSNAGLDGQGQLYMSFAQTSGKVCAMKCNQ
jgi:hypothetical protein